MWKVLVPGAALIMYASWSLAKYETKPATVPLIASSPVQTAPANPTRHRRISPASCMRWSHGPMGYVYAWDGSAEDCDTLPSYYHQTTAGSTRLAALDSYSQSIEAAREGKIPSEVESGQPHVSVSPSETLMTEAQFASLYEAAVSSKYEISEQQLELLALSAYTHCTVSEGVKNNQELADCVFHSPTGE